MSHFAARAWGEFTVEVEFGVGDGRGGGPVRLAVGPLVAEEVNHGSGGELGGRAEREAADGAELLFELAGDIGVNSEVAGVVRAGGEFVDEECAGFGDEELDA